MSKSKRDLVLGNYGDDPRVFESRIQKIVEKVFVDGDGLVIGAVKGATLRKYTARDMRGVPLEKTLGKDLGAPHKYKLLLLNYEETGMAQGDYLMAMIEKHSATGSAYARGQAQRTFSAIRQLADTAAKINPYGRGWWPKPYGGMKDLDEMFETSIDQVVKIVLGLAQYERTLAAVAQRRWIRSWVCALADWWIEHHYTTRYFGNVCWWDLLPGSHSAAALLYMAKQAMDYTPGRLPKNLARAWDELQDIKPRLMQKFGGLNCHNLTIECLAELDRLDPKQRATWVRARNAMVHHTIDVTDADTGTNTIPGYGKYNTGLRTACSLATVDRWLGCAKNSSLAWRLLGLYNTSDRFYHHDQTHRPPMSPVYWWRDAISGHNYVAWLLAYWRLVNNKRDYF